MSQYQTAVAAMQTRHGIAIGADTTATMLASELRKLARNTPYIRCDQHVMGIIRAGAFLPRASDAAPKATVVLSAPQTPAEEASLTHAMVDYLSAHPGIAGSAYDPAFAREWSDYRTMMADLRAQA